MLTDPATMDELFETDSFDVTVDWGKYPELELDPEDVDVPEHIGEFLESDGSTANVNKAAPEQRLATGWANVLTEPDGTPMFDREGDSMEEDTLVRAVAKFMERPQAQRTVRDTHRPGDVGTVVESLVVTKALRAALGLPDTFPTGWLATVHVTSDDVWGKVQRGEYRSFSMGGSGVRTALP